MKITKEYSVQMEIAGSAAMFNRPDTGASFVSYPAPTFSAAKGMFESVARFKSAYIRPKKVEICRPVQFHRYVTNYGGPLRKQQQIAGDNSFQLNAIVLIDVCYRLYGTIEEATPSPNHTNHLHALQEMFLRRLRKGQWFSTPCLGWKEFTPSYVGPFRETTKVDESVNLEIPSMLHMVFDRPIAGQAKPQFRQNVRIEKGVLNYA